MICRDSLVRKFDLRSSFGLWIALSLFALMSVYPLFAFFVEAHNYLFAVGIVCWALLKSNVLIVLWNLFKSKKVLRWGLICFFVGFSVLSIINFFCCILYGFGLNRRFIMIMLQTNPNEIRGFLPGMLYNLKALLLSTETLYSLAAIGVFIILVRILDNLKVFNQVFWSISIAGLIYFIYFCFTNKFNRTEHFLLPTCALSVRDVWADIRSMRQMSGQIVQIPNAETVSSEFKADNIVLILGESASSGHWGEYGYPLNTTPRISSCAEELYIFRDVIASAPNTAESLPKILTFEPDSAHSAKWYEYPSMFQVFQEADYKTYWVSNQDMTVYEYGTYSAIASRADDVRYIGAINCRDRLSEKYDEDLIPEVRDIFNDSAEHRLIVLHLHGSHVFYRDRYPQHMSIFTGSDIMSVAKGSKPWLTSESAQTVAEYDNSIYYTDSILYEIKEIVKKQNNPSVMIYVSDHGEHVFDERNFLGRDDKNVKVPMFIYSNLCYKIKNPVADNAMSSAVDLPITSASLIHSLLSMSGTMYESYRPSEDFLSESFRPRVRYVDQLPWQPDLNNPKLQKLKPQ